MAVTTPRLESEDASERWNDLRIDAWLLCAEFVQRIVSEARAEASEDLFGDVPDVDWDSIWRAGDGAPSDEAAIGRVVRAASEAARGISSIPPESLPQSLPTHASNGAAVLEGAPLARPSDTVVPVEPLAHPVEPSAPVALSAPAPDPAPAPADVPAPVAEALATPV